MQVCYKSGFSSVDFDGIKAIVEKHALGASPGPHTEVLPIKPCRPFCMWLKDQHPTSIAECCRARGQAL